MLAPVGLRRDDRRYYGNYTRVNRRKHDTSLSFWTHHGCNLESNAPERSARASRALKAGDARAPLMCEIRYGEGRDDGTTSIARNGIANSKVIHDSGRFLAAGVADHFGRNTGDRAVCRNIMQDDGACGDVACRVSTGCHRARPGATGTHAAARTNAGLTRLRTRGGSVATHRA